MGKWVKQALWINPRNPLNFSKKESIPHGPVSPKDGRDSVLVCPAPALKPFPLEAGGVILATILEQSFLGWEAECSFSFSFPQRGNSK